MMTTRKKNSTCGWCGQPTAVNRPHTRKDCEMAFSKPFKYEDLLKEYKKLKTKSDRYDALVAAAKTVCQNAHGYDFMMKDKELESMEKLARLLGDE